MSANAFETCSRRVVTLIDPSGQKTTFEIPDLGRVVFEGRATGGVGSQGGPRFCQINELSRAAFADRRARGIATNNVVPITETCRPCQTIFDGKLLRPPQKTK